MPSTSSGFASISAPLSITPSRVRSHTKGITPTGGAGGNAALATLESLLGDMLQRLGQALDKDPFLDYVALKLRSVADSRRRDQIKFAILQLLRNEVDNAIVEPMWPDDD